MPIEFDFLLLSLPRRDDTGLVWACPSPVQSECCRSAEHGCLIGDESFPDADRARNKPELQGKLG